MRPCPTPATSPPARSAHLLPGEGLPHACHLPPARSAHLLPGEGREESQAAPLLQLLPLSLPVEVLVPLAAAEEQNIPWANKHRVASSLASAHEAQPSQPWPPPCPGPHVLTGLTLGHSLLDSSSEGGHASARSHHDHGCVLCLWEGQAPRPYPQGHPDRSYYRREGAGGGGWEDPVLAQDWSWYILECGPWAKTLPHLTLPRVQRCQPGGAEAPAWLLEACLVLYHSHEDLQSRGMSLRDRTVGALPSWATSLPP